MRIAHSTKDVPNKSTCCLSEHPAMPTLFSFWYAAVHLPNSPRFRIYTCRVKAETNIRHTPRSSCTKPLLNVVHLAHNVRVAHLINKSCAPFSLQYPEINLLSTGTAQAAAAQLAHIIYTNAALVVMKGKTKAPNNSNSVPNVEYICVRP